MFCSHGFAGGPSLVPPLLRLPRSPVRARSHPHHVHHTSTSSCLLLAARALTSRNLRPPPLPRLPRSWPGRTTATLIATLRDYFTDFQTWVQPSFLKRLAEAALEELVRRAVNMFAVAPPQVGEGERTR